MSSPGARLALLMVLITSSVLLVRPEDGAHYEQDGYPFGRPSEQYLLAVPSRDDYHSNVNLRELSQEGSVGADEEAKPERQDWLTSLQRASLSRAARSPMLLSSVYSNLNSERWPLTMSASHGDNLIGQMAPMHTYDERPQQSLAARQRLWAQDIVRGLLQQEKQRTQLKRSRPIFGLQQRQQQQPIQQRNLNGAQAMGQGLVPVAANEINTSESQAPANREKRRRCKSDPNLSVKNPSFCDTDAYFGAADYSMRDVWDSAGR